MGLIRQTVRKALQKAVSHYGWELKRVERGQYRSETSKCRLRLAPYCKGNGVDLGPGGDPILDTAIRIDLPDPYSRAGPLPVQLRGDATKLCWFRDCTLDYVYSSHLLEDFEDIETVLREWLRVLKPGGNLVIFCPDQKAYIEYCRAKRLAENLQHKDPNFSLQTVKAALERLGGTCFIHENPLVDIYSWELVATKTVPSRECLARVP